MPGTPASLNGAQDLVGSGNTDGPLGGLPSNGNPQRFNIGTVPNLIATFRGHGPLLEGPRGHQKLSSQSGQLEAVRFAVGGRERIETLMCILWAGFSFVPFCGRISITPIGGTVPVTIR
jgi:hypothetical protein